MQESYYLAPRARRIGAEARRARALSYAVCNCPLNGLRIVVAGAYITEADISRNCRRARCSVHKGHDLSAITGLARAELAAACSLRDTVCNRPFYGVCVVGAFGNIAETGLTLDYGRACRTPQESDRLCAGAALVRGEHNRTCAGGDPVADSPFHGVRIILTCWYVKERTHHAVQISPGVLNTHCTADVIQRIKDQRPCKELSFLSLHRGFGSRGTVQLTANKTSGTIRVAVIVVLKGARLRIGST